MLMLSYQQTVVGMKNIVNETDEKYLDALLKTHQIQHLLDLRQENVNNALIPNP